MFPPLPPFTSIVRVTLTGVPPLLLTVNVMSTVFPAVRETAERLAAPIWIEGSGEVNVASETVQPNQSNGGCPVRSGIDRYARWGGASPETGNWDIDRDVDAVGQRTAGPGHCYPVVSRRDAGLGDYV